MKKVYVPMAADLLHDGHMNILNEASKLGEVTVGLLTDRAIANYKRLPILTFEQRKKVIENIRTVSKVYAQEDDDYIPAIRELKPDYFVHGDDWKIGIQAKKRQRVIEVMKEWGGQVVEPLYTQGISSTQLITKVKQRGITPDIRRNMLRRLLDAKSMIRILEAHNGLTGIIVEKTMVKDEDNVPKTFDATWLSSLTHATSKGKPDIEYVDITSIGNTVSEIFEVTTKPMLVDADSGGLIEHFRFTVKTLERLGVSAVVIEDKIGSKRNSLFETEVEQNQDTIENFCRKISEGKKSQASDDFMIIARIESLILKKGLADALERAKAYIAAGADGIMIHSKEKNPEEILQFCKEYKKFETKVSLVVVPSTYSIITEEELITAGVNMVVYANHLLRSAYPAMVKTAESILKNKRSYEASNEQCMSIKEIITLIPNGE
ncbi:phosphoenolpyruvate mutase [Candidatus Woesearchaeota archaeon]|nr:phosphoenolpyruvate mutase [Candidatus Woesearchaeota archaeon]